MPTATVTSKGQTTIPKEIRDYLKLHPGDQIDFIAEDDGTVTLVPAMTDIMDLKAVLHRAGRIVGRGAQIIQCLEMYRQQIPERIGCTLHGVGPRQQHVDNQAGQLSAVKKRLAPWACN